MGDIYMTNKAGTRLVKLFIGGMILFLVLVAIVFAQSYFGRNDLADSEERAQVALIASQRAGCERSKLDRKANASGWRTAQAARLRSLADQLDISYKSVQQLVAQDPTPDDPGDLVAARKYNALATELEKRSKINCAEAFPSKPRL